MSRCFPFPPPGYARNSDALIESMKLQNENKKAKKDRRKEKRREKKDKESKKEKRKGKEGTASHASDGGKKFKLIEPEKESGCVPKGAYYENEQLERSDITEEHGQPVTTPDPCCSDSNQSSNKRKRSTSPSRHDYVTVNKIQFSLRKHTAHEESKLEGQLVCASRVVGTADSLAHDTFGGNPRLTCVTNAERDQCHRDSRHCEALQSLSNGAAHNTNLLDDEGTRMVSMYNSLFQNWVPPPATYDGFESKGQDWLFSSEQQEERNVSKTVKVVTGTLWCSSASLWPRAQYLPGVELYALPYAVPF